MKSHSRQAAQELASVIHGASRRAARQEHAPQVDEFGTVSETDPVVIDLHSGISITEDTTYFSTLCPPEDLAVGDTVVVICIDTEYSVIAVVRMGAKANP